MDQVYVSRNSVFSAATGAKTLLKIVTGAAFLLKVHEIGVSMDGVTSSAVPATLDIFTSDETTAGTGGGSPVTTQIKGLTVAHGTTVTCNHTAEGTTYTVVKSLFAPQYMGLLVLQNPLGLEEQALALSDSIGLRINTSATVNVLAWIKWSRA